MRKIGGMSPFNGLSQRPRNHKSYAGRSQAALSRKDRRRDPSQENQHESITRHATTEDLMGESRSDDDFASLADRHRDADPKRLSSSLPSALARGGRRSLDNIGTSLGRHDATPPKFHIRQQEAHAPSAWDQSCSPPSSSLPKDSDDIFPTASPPPSPSASKSRIHVQSSPIRPAKKRSPIPSPAPVPTERENSSFRNFFSIDRRKQGASAAAGRTSSETQDGKPKPKKRPVNAFKRKPIFSSEKLREIIGPSNDNDVADESSTLFRQAMAIANSSQNDSDDDSFINNDDSLVAGRGYEYYEREQKKILEQGKERKYPETLDFKGIRERVLLIFEDLKGIIAGQGISFYQETVSTNLYSFLRRKLVKKRLTSNGFDPSHIHKARTQLSGDLADEKAQQEREKIREIIQQVETLPEWELCREFKGTNPLSVKEVLELHLRSDTGYYGPATQDIIIKMVTEILFDQLNDIVKTHRKRKLRPLADIEVAYYKRPQHPSASSSFTDSQNSIGPTSSFGPSDNDGSVHSPLSSFSQSQPQSQQIFTQASEGVGKFTIPLPPALWWLNIFGIPNYVSYVISPEVITRLIEEDLKVNIMSAREVLEDSTPYGNIRFPSSLNGGILENGNDSLGERQDHELQSILAAAKQHDGETDDDDELEYDDEEYHVNKRTVAGKVKASVATKADSEGDAKRQPAGKKGKAGTAKRPLRKEAEKSIDLDADNFGDLDDDAAPTSGQAPQRAKKDLTLHSYFTENPSAKPAVAARPAATSRLPSSDGESDNDDVFAALNARLKTNAPVPAPALSRDSTSSLSSLSNTSESEPEDESHNDSGARKRRSNAPTSSAQKRAAKTVAPVRSVATRMRSTSAGLASSKSSQGAREPPASTLETGSRTRKRAHAATHDSVDDSDDDDARPKSVSQPAALSHNTADGSPSVIRSSAPALGNGVKRRQLVRTPASISAQTKKPTSKADVAAMLSGAKVTDYFAAVSKDPQAQAQVQPSSSSLPAERRVAQIGGAPPAAAFATRDFGNDVGKPADLENSDDDLF